MDPPAGTVVGVRATTTLRVCSFNIWGLFGDWPQRLEIIVREWGKVDADVVMLQEVCRGAGHDQLAELSEGLGYPFMARASTIAHTDGVEEGVALLSRRPLMHVESVLLPHSQPMRVLLMADVAFGGETVKVATTHAAFHPEPAIDRQLERILAVGGGRVALGGDLNVTPARVAATRGHERFADALAGHEGRTWPVCSMEEFAASWRAKTGREMDFPIHPGRLDHLLIRGLRVASSSITILGGPDLGYASDHASVIADLDL